jgi:hypothetical protein
MIKRIKEFIDGKLLDTVLRRVLDYLNQLNPRVYSLVLSVCVMIHTYATITLQHLTELCEEGLWCFESTEATVATVLYWISLIIGLLSGTKKFSDIKK